MLKQVLSRLTRPVTNVLIRSVHFDNIWERRASSVPTCRYGMGAKQEFETYFERESTVRIAQIEALLDWLRTCEYMRDMKQFNTWDYWVHPVDLEMSRRGDCEDFALWAWRKLVKQMKMVGAEFVAGRAVCQSQGLTGHTWIHVHHQGQLHLLDPVPPTPTLRPLDEVRDCYIPEVSIDGAMNRYVYGGYFSLCESDNGNRPAA